MLELIPCITSSAVTAIVTSVILRRHYHSKIAKIKLSYREEIAELRKRNIEEVKKVRQLHQKVKDVTSRYESRIGVLEREREKLKSSFEERIQLIKKEYGKDKIIGERIVCECRRVSGPTLIPRGKHRVQRYTMVGYPAMAVVEKEWRR
jgi:uncharacterized protein YlxW (UPF0749 family)